MTTTNYNLESIDFEVFICEREIFHIFFLFKNIEKKMKFVYYHKCPRCGK